MSQLDPSISFGFLIQKYDDFVNLHDELIKINVGLPEELKILTIHGQNREELMADGRQGLLFSFSTIQSDYIKNNW